MLTPEWQIRDCRDEDMELIRYLFASEGFSDLTDPANIRVAATPDNTIYGACRLEQAPDGSWNVRPIVVFDVVQGKGVGKSLLRDALRLHPNLLLVSRGSAEGFYLSCGFERGTWDDVDTMFVEECNLCPDRDNCAPQVYKAKPIERTLTFLGTSSGCGVPAFFCHCPACEAARKDPSLSRGCTGVVLQGHGTTLIDTPPDIRHQLIREGVDSIDELFLTHAHYDHMGGFGELEYFIRLNRGASLPFHAHEHALKECFKEFSYMDDCFTLDEVGEYETRFVDGMSIQALPLVHTEGTYGYLITTESGRRTFYAPDTAKLLPEVVEALKGVDNLIMDSTYWGDNGRPSTHRSAQETVHLGLEVLDAGTVYLQHLAPHMSAPDDNWIEDLYEYAAGFEGRVVVAEDGMKIRL